MQHLPLVFHRAHFRPQMRKLKQFSNEFDVLYSCQPNLLFLIQTTLYFIQGKKGHHNLWMSIEILFFYMSSFFGILMDSWLYLLLGQHAEATECWVPGAVFSSGLSSSIPSCVALCKLLKPQFSSTA